MLENENVDEKNMSSCEKSKKLSAAVGAAENRAAGLTSWLCDVGLTSTWFEAALLDVNSLPDLPDINKNVTECHCGFLHLQCQHCGASISEAWCC